MKKMEYRIVEAFFREKDSGKIKELVWFDEEKPFKNELELLNYFGERGWIIGAAIKMPARSNIIVEVYKYYFWRPKH